METTRLIEQYLDGTLEKEEAEKVLARMTAEEKFNDLVLLHQEVNTAIGDHDFFDLQTKIQRAEAAYLGIEKNKVQEPSIKRMRTNMMRIAAVMIFLVCAGVIIKMVFFNAIDAEDLYLKYYSTYAADVISRSAQTEQRQLDLAIIQYDRKNYAEALSQLNMVLKADERNFLAWFYKGLTDLEMNDTDNAIRSFVRIPDTWDSPYIEHRDWYLALAWLRSGNLQRASDIFHRISISGGYYALKASELYSKIRI